MKIFRILIIMAGMISACQSVKEKGEQKQQVPNIIFIMSDDHSLQAICAYGGDLTGFVPTPNIDKMAK